MLPFSSASYQCSSQTLFLLFFSLLVTVFNETKRRWTCHSCCSLRLSRQYRAVFCFFCRLTGLGAMSVGQRLWNRFQIVVMLTDVATKTISKCVAPLLCLSILLCVVSGCRHQYCVSRDIYSIIGPSHRLRALIHQQLFRHAIRSNPFYYVYVCQISYCSGSKWKCPR